MLYIYFFGPSHSKPISALLAVNIELFMFLGKKTGLFTKFVDSYFFFSVCRQKSFLMYNSENWDIKNIKRIISDTAVFSGKKGCFY